jgi:hypothetical protein
MDARRAQVRASLPRTRTREPRQEMPAIDRCEGYQGVTEMPLGTHASRGTPDGMNGAACATRRAVTGGHAMSIGGIRSLLYLRSYAGAVR